MTWKEYPESKPEEGQEVLAVTLCDGMMSADFWQNKIYHCTYAKDDFRVIFSAPDDDYLYPTHWMDLPELPLEER